MLIALYLYNYKEKEAVTEKETSIENKSDEIAADDKTSASIEAAGVKEVCCQLISSSLTDVNDNLLYGLGNGIGNCAHSFCNEIQAVFAQASSRAQA